MAKSPASTDRSDPKNNKSLAIRNILKKMPKAKATEVVEAVKKEYGHSLSPNMVYMVKTKGNMASNRRATKGKGANGKAATVGTPMTTARLWVDAIKTARQLLKVTGSVENATALLKAVEG